MVTTSAVVMGALHRPDVLSQLAANDARCDTSRGPQVFPDDDILSHTIEIDGNTSVTSLTLLPLPRAFFLVSLVMSPCCAFSSLLLPLATSLECVGAERAMHAVTTSGSKITESSNVTRYCIVSVYSEFSIFLFRLFPWGGRRASIRPKGRGCLSSLVFPPTFR